MFATRSPLTNAHGLVAAVANVSVRRRTVAYEFAVDEVSPRLTALDVLMDRRVAVAE